MDMTDPNLVDFYGRVAKINRDHAKGYGFEAVGTLGRSAYARRDQKSLFLRILKPLLTIAVCGVALKGAIHNHIGAEVYDTRVQALVASDGIDRLGGYLMLADPATLWVSGELTKAFGPGL
jgi:hypothetical protein